VIGDDYWYSSWKADDGNYYMVVLSMLEDAEATQEVSISLNKDGDAAYGSFNAIALSGRIDEDGVGEIVAGKDNLKLTLTGSEAVLYKITEKEMFEIEVNNNTNTGSSEAAATITAPESGWTVGENTFTVSHEKSCVVLITKDDGQTYERLEATQNEDGSYSFTAEMDADTQIAVAVAGDSNGDGKISNADITRLRAAYAGKIELDGHQEIVVDVNGSGTITNADITKLRAAYAGKINLGW